MPGELTMKNTRFLFHVLPLVATIALLVFAAPSFAQPDDPIAQDENGSGEITSVAEMDVEEIEDVETLPVEVPVPSEKAMRYYRSGNALFIIGFLVAAAIPLLILFTGWSSKFRDFGLRIGKKWWFAFLIYFMLITVVMSLITLPLDIYSDFVRPHSYDLSTQSFGNFMGDWVKSLLVGIIMGGLFLWIPFVLLQKSPKRWWLWFGIGSIPFIALIMLITPIWVDPLFNDYGPMQDQELEAKILALADRAGIEGSDVFEVNMSEKTRQVNAYVTGIGATSRIVLWDTIIAKMTDRELLFVMGHEMGHYLFGHVYQMIFVGALLITLAFYVIHRTAGWFFRRWGGRVGVHELSDFASLPLIMLLVGIVFFLLTPVLNTWSRANEHSCDTFGLELTHDNYAAAMAFVKLQQENLANPDPGWLYKLWRLSHPSLAERIRFCNEYKPWETGQPLKYEKYIRPYAEEESSEESPPEGELEE